MALEEIQLFGMAPMERRTLAREIAAREGIEIEEHL
jgi:hypothetical protein